MSEMKSYRCTIMRGGTSKAVFMLENHLPSDLNEMDKVVLKIMGSPDIRQIDGLGGAVTSTSKFAVIGPPSRPDADVDYTFLQVQFKKAEVGRTSNCGNISSAVGPFAIDYGLVRPTVTDGMVPVRIHQKNTGRILTAQVPVHNGEPAVKGDCVIDGVPGSGAKITIDYSDTVGSVFKKLLPTGNVTDILSVPGLGDIEVSIIDVGNPVLFVRASSLGLKGTELPAEFPPETVALFERIRGAALVKIGGYGDTSAEAVKRLPVLPITAVVSDPADYTDLSGKKVIRAEEMDIVARFSHSGDMHKASPGTAAICTASAVKIRGSIPYQIAKNAEDLKKVRIGHPSGTIEIEVDADYSVEPTRVTNVSMYRTARKIMEGYVYTVE